MVKRGFKDCFTNQKDNGGKEGKDIYRWNESFQYIINSC